MTPRFGTAVTATVFMASIWKGVIVLAAVALLNGISTYSDAALRPPTHRAAASAPVNVRASPSARPSVVVHGGAANVVTVIAALPVFPPLVAVIVAVPGP